MSPAGKRFLHRSRALIAASSIALLFAAQASAIEVDRAELEKSGKERIIFINYEGPHATIDSAEDILGIGRSLGRAIKDGAVKAGDSKRYYAVHSASAEKPESAQGGGTLDADVIGLGVDAGVDHIRNLRLILRGFLESAYGYSSADAALLAEFATVYNAVHRGDWDYYSSRYNAKALGSLDKGKVGLSVRFDEWPGRAMIVIPLSSGAKPGSLSAVDTTPLTEKKVVDELRKKDDLGLDSRKGMVDLKEREASDAKQKADLEREAIVDEEKKIAAEKAAVQAEKDKLAAEKAAAEKAEKAAAEKAEKAAAASAKAEPGTPADAQEKKAESERQATKEAIAEKEKTIAAKEESIAKKEEAVAEKKDAAAKTEAFAEKKQDEANAERKDIAQDQQKLIQKEEAAAAAEPKQTGELSMKMVSSDGPYARFVLIELSSGKELKASALDTVRSRSVAEVGGKIIAVAGKSGGAGAVRLIAVDKESLEMIKQGEDDIHPDSPLWISGDAIYALTVNGGTIKLGQYDAELKRKAVSKDALHPFAALRFADGLVLTQAADGSPLTLKAGDLSAASK